MINPDNKKRWSLSLVIIALVIIASVALILLNWSPTYPLSSGVVFGWLFGLPIGLTIWYLWNLLVLSLTLRHLPGSIAFQPSMKARRSPYAFSIAFLGIIIIEAYRELIWDAKLGEIILLVPEMSMPLQLVLALVPMTMLWLVNFALSYSYLKLEQRQASILAAVMAFFTAPWLHPTIPYVFGRVA